MRKFDEYSEIVELLVRSLQENISADEQMLIDVWRKEDPMNEAIYQKILSPEYWDKHPQQKYQGDIVKAWVRLCRGPHPGAAVLHPRDHLGYVCMNAVKNRSTDGVCKDV